MRRTDGLFRKKKTTCAKPHPKRMGSLWKLGLYTAHFPQRLTPQSESCKLESPFSVKPREIKLRENRSCKLISLEDFTKVS